MLATCMFHRYTSALRVSPQQNWIRFKAAAHSAGNKAKGRISKRVFQEDKAHRIFRKTNICYPLIRTLIRG